MDLLDDPVRLEGRERTRVQRDLVGQVGGNLTEVVHDEPVDTLRIGHEPAVLLVGEEVAHDPDRELRLLVEHRGCLPLRRGRLDLIPDREQPPEVRFERLFGRGLGRRAHDHAVLRRLHLAHHGPKPAPFGVGQAPGQPEHLRVRHQHEVPPGQADLTGQPGALPAEGVLRHLDQDRLPGLEGLFDPAGLALDLLVPVHLARVEHGVAPAADVDECRLHAGQDVLHSTEVDVPDHRGRPRPGHVMLDQEVFFEHRDLVAVAALGDDHQLVRHARRRRQGLPAAPAVAARAAPGRADPAGRPAGGHLLLDRLRLGGAGAGRLRCGRLAGGRRSARSGRSGRGAVGLVGSGR